MHCILVAQYFVQGVLLFASQTVGPTQLGKRPGWRYRESGSGTKNRKHTTVLRMLRLVSLVETLSLYALTITVSEGIGSGRLA